VYLLPGVPPHGSGKPPLQEAFLDTTQLLRAKEKITHCTESLLQRKSHTGTFWKPWGYPTGFLLVGVKGGKVTVFSMINYICASPLVEKCETICRKKSKNLCSMDMKVVFSNSH